ncbi:MAG TPA: hypothetical protein VFF98_14985 [Novosphingobium sp.]|nr:hypothetical protein [Novosphingobium sp.]
MTATNPERPFALPGTAAPAIALEARWAALRQAALAAVALAGPVAHAQAAGEVEFPPALRTVTGARRGLLEQGLDDLVAVMEAGLTALLEVHARGGNATVPASALWEEFVLARKALLALVPAVTLASRPG